MTPEERQALFDRYIPKREDVDPEERKRTEDDLKYREEKIARGEVLESWSKDNNPIGLDSNMKPFPVRTAAAETPADTDSPDESPQARTETAESAPEGDAAPVGVSVPWDAVMAYGVGREVHWRRDDTDGPATDAGSR